MTPVEEHRVAAPRHGARAVGAVVDAEAKPGAVAPVAVAHHVAQPGAGGDGVQVQPVGLLRPDVLGGHGEELGLVVVDQVDPGVAAGQ